MRFSLILLLFIFNDAHALKGRCKKKVEDIVEEISEKQKYGIIKSDGGVTSFPKKCTPFMKLKKMIPIPKRSSAGVSRQRYLGKDCQIYEWDSQHGGFETYKPSGNYESFYHKGESTPLHGILDAKKADSKRDNNDSSTGLDGIRMKDLCKKHKKGKLTEKEMKRSKAGKDRISCL